jgi:hypothetical protein
LFCKETLKGNVVGVEGERESEGAYTDKAPVCKCGVKGQVIQLAPGAATEQLQKAYYCTVYNV